MVVSASDEKKTCKKTYDCRNATVTHCYAMDCIDGFCMKAYICNGDEDKKYGCSTCKKLVNDVKVIKNKKNIVELLNYSCLTTVKNEEKQYCLKFVTWYEKKLIDEKIDCHEIKDC